MKVTARFTNTEGQVLVATFDQATGKVQDNMGRGGTFSAVPGSKLISIKGDGSPDVSFEVADAVQFVAGFSTSYKASTGKSGTVVIDKIE